MFPLVDAYISTLLQSSESAKVPALPTTQYMLPDKYSESLAVESATELGVPYFIEPLFQPVQMYTNYVRAPPHSLTSDWSNHPGAPLSGGYFPQINGQEGVSGEWTRGIGGTGTFPSLP